MEFIDILKSHRLPEMRSIMPRYDCEDPETEDYIWEVLREAESYNLHVSYCHGATQMCFIDHDAKIVYKISFTHTLECGYTDEDEEYDVYIEFHHDYTGESAVMSKFFNENNVAMFFAEVSPACIDQSGQTIYKQKMCKDLWYCKTDQDEGPHYSNDSYEKAKKIIKENTSCSFDTVWCASCIEKYGINIFTSLIDFIYNYDISDLHGGNYGWDEDGLPVIFDFVGFDE